MIGKFLWGVAWRTMAFTGVVGAGLWYANRGPDWHGNALIEKNDTRLEGKAGVLVVALIQPGHFDPRFYHNFVDKIFTQIIPWPINALAGTDTGIVLVDPDNPYQQTRYQPRRLVNIHGSEADVDGIPWVEKFQRGQLRWEKPSTTTPHDFGFFLYPERKQGMRTAAAKTIAKIKYIYYARLPQGYLPHEDQTRKMAQGAVDLVRQQHPIVGGEVVDAFDPWKKEQAVFRLLDAGADTIVLASAQSLYSDFEELDGSFVAVHKAVEEWRARHGGKPVKIVIPPYLAAQPEFEEMLLRHFAASVPQASRPGQSAMGILTFHGMPPSLLAHDSWTPRAAAFEARLKPRIAEILTAKGYAKVEARFGSESFADQMEDPDNKVVSVHELFEAARKAQTDVAVAVPIEFMAENTDSLFAHPSLIFDGYPGYQTYMGPPAGTDWSKPYVRQLTLGKTRVIYGGTMGGADVGQQSKALAAAIGRVFR